MVKKSRLGLYLEDEEIKTQVKIAAASMRLEHYCLLCSSHPNNACE